MGILATLATKLREMNVFLASEDYKNPGAAEIVYKFKKQLYPLAQGECDDLADRLKWVRDKINDAIGQIDAADGTLDSWKATLDGIPGLIEARVVALYIQIRDETLVQLRNLYDTDINPRITEANTRLNGIRDKAGAEWDAISQEATDKGNAALAAANQNISTQIADIQAQVKDIQTQIAGMQAQVKDIQTRLPKRTPAEQAAYFKNLARPAYEETMEFFVQNSLWNLRNKTEGSLEWDPVAKEAKDRANAALAAANQNISGVDARLAKMIEDSNGRTTELENKLPLTSAALNKRIDEAEQAATDKANAALAAANENIVKVKDDLNSKASDLDARLHKMEIEVEKVAPVLARLPALPVP